MPRHRWVLDSGASRHMCNDASFFCGAMQDPPATDVRVGNGVALQVHGTGTVALHNSTGGCVHLSNVLYVPGLVANLVSVFSLCQQPEVRILFEQDCAYLAHGQECRIFDIARAVHPGLYLMSACYPVPQQQTTWPQAHSLDTVALLSSSTSSASLTLWHRRLGHLNFHGVRAVAPVVCDMHITSKHKHDHSICAACAVGKLVPMSYPAMSETVWTKPVQLVHMDVLTWPVHDLHGYKYLTTVIDQYSSYAAVVLLKTKSAQEVLAAVQSVLEPWARVHSYPLQLSVDGGGEYQNHLLEAWCVSKGTTYVGGAPYAHEQNGKAERYNLTLANKVRAVMADACLPDLAWGEIASSCAILTNLSVPAKQYLTSYQLFWGRAPSLRHLRVLGSLAYVLVPNTTARKKLDARGRPAVLVGYQPHCKAYRFMAVNAHGAPCILVRRDARIDESRCGWPLISADTSRIRNLVLGDWHQSKLLCNQLTDQLTVAAPPVLPFPPLTVAANADEPQVPQPHLLQAGGATVDTPRARMHTHQQPDTRRVAPASPTSLHDSPPESTQAPGNSAPGSAQPAPQHDVSSAPRRSTRERTAPDRYDPSAALLHFVQHAPDDQVHCLVAAAVHGDKPTARQALQGPYASKYMAAMQAELRQLIEHGTFEVVRIPVGVTPTKCKWVLVCKRDADGNVEKYKGRLVFRGDLQDPHDYDNLYAPTGRLDAVRLLVATVCAFDMHWVHLDVSNAFLNGTLARPVYMELPAHVHVPGASQGDCLKLLKTLYGLRQAPKEWHDVLNDKLCTTGLKPTETDCTFHVCRIRGVLVLLKVWVDDMILACKCAAVLQDLIRQIQSFWKVRDLGEPSQFLGIKMERDHEQGTIKISQPKLCHDIMSITGLQEANPCVTPMVPNTRLEPPADGEVSDPLADPPAWCTAAYRTVVGKYGYLVQGSHPDLAFVYMQLARNQEAPTKACWDTIKHATRYLRAYADEGITYRRDAGFQLSMWCDADFAQHADYKSVTGWVAMLAGGAIAWSCSKQPNIATSTAQAEMIAAYEATCQAIYLRDLMMELQLLPTDAGPTPVYCDNSPALSAAEKPQTTNRNKHWGVKLHYVREQQKLGVVKLIHVPSSDQIADALTKAMPKAGLKHCLEGMGYGPPPKDQEET